MKAHYAKAVLMVNIIQEFNYQVLQEKIEKFKHVCKHSMSNFNYLFTISWFDF